MLTANVPNTLKELMDKQVCQGWRIKADYCFAICAALMCSTALVAPAAPPQIIADGIPLALTATKGDANRGRSIVANRQLGLCTLCHQLADVAVNGNEKFQGNLSINLAGVGARLTEAQLRLRIVDNRQVTVKSIMPAFYRLDNLSRVGHAWEGKTIFSAEQVEDVVAYLVSLK